MKMKLNPEVITALAQKHNIDISGYQMDQLIKGYIVETEHCTVTKKPEINVCSDVVDPLKIAIAHLDEFGDYYDRLAKMEEEGKRAKLGKQ